MHFIYSYDLGSLKELWAHLDQRMFSKLEHSFTPCMYYELFLFYHMLLIYNFGNFCHIKSLYHIKILDASFSDCHVYVIFDSCSQAGKCCTQILSG
jgi:hypothetical protein